MEMPKGVRAYLSDTGVTAILFFTQVKPERGVYAENIFLGQILRCFVIFPQQVRNEGRYG